MKDAAAYMNVDGAYDYFGTIYIVSSEDGIAEIETGNYFFNEKNISKGGGGDIPSDVYTKDEVDTKLAAKVGKNDFATKTVGGAVKIDSAYGIEIDSNGTLRTIPAYDNYMQNFTDDNHVITPYRFKKAMVLFGINSETQITEMQEDIVNKVDNDVFVAENLIHYPYNNDATTAGGITFTDNEDGSITLTGSVAKANTNYNYKLNPNEYTKLEIGKTYTLNNCGNLDDDCYLRLFYKADNGTETYLASTKSGSYTFVATETINEVRIWITANCDDTTKEFNNTIKPMLEVGPVAHAYQPYKLSRKAMRDDINALMALLT